MTPTRAKCRSCSAPVFFAASRSAANHPFDAEPSEAGNVRVIPAPGGGFRAVVLSGDRLDTARERGMPLYTSHFATCPDADTWRTKR